MKKETLLFINPTQVMVGFCYGFTLALLQKLLELKKAKKLYLHSCNVTPMTAACVNYLSQQVHFDKEGLDGIAGGHCISKETIDDLIRHAEEFLLIFEKP